MEAVLTVGPDAYLVGETVLAMHNLGYVNPAKVHVATPTRVRAKPPKHIDLGHEDLPATDLTTNEGIPSVTVARALIDCVGTVMGDRLLAAAEQARAEGLLRSGDLFRTLKVAEPQPIPLMSGAQKAPQKLHANGSHVADGPLRRRSHRLSPKGQPGLKLAGHIGSQTIRAIS